MGGCGTLATPNASKPSTTDSGDPITTGTGSGGGTGVGTGGTGTGTGNGTNGCQPIDEWDDENSFDPGVGDTCEEAVSAFGPLDDSGAAATTIAGNIHRDGDVDWYVIDAVDLPGDEAAGAENFNLHIKIVDGVNLVHFTVQRGDCAAAKDCDTEAGLDDYNFYHANSSPDTPLGGQQACSAVGGTYDECPNFSGTYLLRVSSIDGLEQCGKYAIEISNGVW